MKLLYPDKWYEIPGFPNYLINIKGEMKRINGSKRTVTPRRRGRYYYVNLTVDGKRKAYLLHKIVGITFIGVPKEDECYYHKNRDILDNEANNIGIIKKKDLRLILQPSSKSRGKKVALLDKRGKVVEVFKTATEAAKKLYLSPSKITERCNNKIKALPHLKWDKDVKY